MNLPAPTFIKPEEWDILIKWLYAIWLQVKGPFSNEDLALKIAGIEQFDVVDTLKRITDVERKIADIHHEATFEIEKRLANLERKVSGLTQTEGISELLKRVADIERRIAAGG